MKLDTVLAKRENKVVYKDGALAAKVFDECYPKSDILNEALNQARVEETGLNIPKIEEVTKIDGKWAIISTLHRGQNSCGAYGRASRKRGRIPQSLC